LSGQTPKQILRNSALLQVTMTTIQWRFCCLNSLHLANIRCLNGVTCLFISYIEDRGTLMKQDETMNKV